MGFNNLTFYLLQNLNYLFISLVDCGCADNTLSSVDVQRFSGVGQQEGRNGSYLPLGSDTKG